jgi:hypothetical protein
MGRYCHLVGASTLMTSMVGGCADVALDVMMSTQSLAIAQVCE